MRGDGVDRGLPSRIAYRFFCASPFGSVQAYPTPRVYLGGAPTGVPTKVTLESGTQSSGLISGGANPINGETACPPDYAAVLVTAPGGATSTSLALDFPSCTGLAVTPVVSGATGGFFSPLASP